jgi:hypothetical protein
MKKRGFCRFYPELYWGDSVKKRTLVKWRLYHGRGQFTIFCVMRAQAESDQLDIIHCAFLKQPYFRSNPAYIYGIAGSKAEAFDLVVRITEEATEHGCEGNLIKYLDQKADEKKYDGIKAE